MTVTTVIVGQVKPTRTTVEQPCLWRAPGSWSLREPQSPKNNCKNNLGATLCIFACIHKVTHFWPWAIRTFGPESDTHLIRSV